MKNIIQKSKILCMIALFATALFVGVAADAAIGSPIRHGHYVCRSCGGNRVAYRGHRSYRGYHRGYRGYRGHHRGYRGYRSHNRGYRGYRGHNRGYRGHNRGYRGYRGYRGCRGRC